MPTVRCPACAHQTPDPSPTFRCAGCDRLLSWRQPRLDQPLQLGLFGEAVPAEPASRRSRPTRTPSEVLSVGVRSQSLTRSHQDALAAVTELFFDESGHSADGVFRARAFFEGRSNADLREAALGAAFMLASTLRTMEAAVPGSGIDTLQTIGLTLARIDAD